MRKPTLFIRANFTLFDVMKSGRLPVKGHAGPKRLPGATAMAIHVQNAARAGLRQGTAWTRRRVKT